MSFLGYIAERYKVFILLVGVLIFLGYLLFHKRELPFQEERKKMWKNSHKALLEHRKKNPSSLYVKKLPSLVAKKQRRKLNLSQVAYGAQGMRSSMEDANFYVELDEGVFTGVLDGHGGKEVAEFASELLQERFPILWQKMSGNLYSLFCVLIDEVHEEVIKKKQWDYQGCTACLCFIDTKNHLIYTATLGDSEATLYRKGRVIPLSCVRDWSCKKDAKRASIALDRPEIAEEWPKVSNPKVLRYYNHLSCGLNVSRAIGDKSFSGTLQKPIVIHTPKITIHSLKKKDVLIIACDGLKDYVSEKEILHQINTKTEGNLAEHLVDYAIKEGESNDNVTVIAIRVF